MSHVRLEVALTQLGAATSDNNRVAPARPVAAPEKPAQTFVASMEGGSRRRA